MSCEGHLTVAGKNESEVAAVGCDLAGVVPRRIDPDRDNPIFGTYMQCVVLQIPHNAPAPPQGRTVQDEHGFQDVETVTFDPVADGRSYECRQRVPTRRMLEEVQGDHVRKGSYTLRLTARALRIELGTRDVRITDPALTCARATSCAPTSLLRNRRSSNAAALAPNSAWQFAASASAGVVSPLTLRPS